MNQDVWTIPALKEHIDQRFTDEQRAVKIAADALEKKIDGFNEDARETAAFQNRLIGVAIVVSILVAPATAVITYLLTR